MSLFKNISTAHTVTLLSIVRFSFYQSSQALQSVLSKIKILRSYQDQGEPFSLEAITLGGEAITPEDTHTTTALDIMRDGFLLAAPKKRTTYERKRIRNKAKAMKFNANVIICPQCDQPKLYRKLCEFCAREIMRETAEYRKEHGITQSGPLY